MVYMDVSAIALQGLQQAQLLFDHAARRIAAQPADDTVALSEEAVALMSSKHQFEANLNVLKVADNMQKSLLNLLG
jgi:hypothetical protein